jgi:hypothetical protein
MAAGASSGMDILVGSNMDEFPLFLVPGGSIGRRGAGDDLSLWAGSGDCAVGVSKVLSERLGEGSAGGGFD